jgi:Ca-activated chloride channel homolog
MNGRHANARRGHDGAPRTWRRLPGAHRRLPVPLALVLALLMTGGVDHKAAKLNNQANEQYEAAKLDDASKLYDEAQTRAPDSPEIAYNRGNALYRQGKLEDAARQLMQGTQSTDPDLRRRSYYNLGNALHDLKKLDEAAAAYRHALAIDPRNRDAKINYEKTLDELQQQQKQPQDSQSKSDKNKQQQQKGQQGQQQKDGQQSDDQQAQRGDQKDQQNQQDQQQQSGDQGKDKQGEEQQAQSGDDPKEQNPEEEARQAAAIDSVAAGDLSREEAVRILEAMREQERELQRERARKPVRSRRVEKDW